MRKNRYAFMDEKKTATSKQSWILRWVITTAALMVITSLSTFLVMTQKLGFKTQAEFELLTTWDSTGLTAANKSKDVVTVTAPSDAIYWENDDLHIDGSKLADGFNSFNWGSKTKFLAYKNESGQILTAFSTCQTCYTRGEITFSIIDGLLHCSGCSTTQDPAIFGTAAWGGCKPIAVPINYREDTNGIAVVPKEIFLYAATMFAEWDKGVFTTTFANYSADTNNNVVEQ